MLKNEGLIKTLAWAGVTKTVYKKSILANGTRTIKGKVSRKHHASCVEFRRSFIESYLVLKHFLKPTTIARVSHAGIYH